MTLPLLEQLAKGKHFQARRKAQWSRFKCNLTWGNMDWFVDSAKPRVLHLFKTKRLSWKQKLFPTFYLASPTTLLRYNWAIWPLRSHKIISLFFLNLLPQACMLQPPCIPWRQAAVCSRGYSCVPDSQSCHQWKPSVPCSVVATVFTCFARIKKEQMIRTETRWKQMIWSSSKCTR